MDATSEIGASSIFLSSLAAAEIVIDIFVPVSPSGTGKIFKSFSACFLAHILFAPEMMASLNTLPVIISSHPILNDN